MPRRLLIIGLLFCLGGLLALVQVITDLVQGRININLAVFLLPIGIGLLRGKERARWWARACIIVGGYVTMGLIMIIVLLNPDSANVKWPGGAIQGRGAVPYVIIIALLVGAFFRLLHMALYSEKVSAYMENRSKAIS